MSEAHASSRVLSRRDLLRGRFLGSLVQHVEARIEAQEPRRERRPGRSFPLHRPPGAAPEPEFLHRCTGCADCVEACPHDALSLASARFREAADTPLVQPLASPCRLCADMPCIAACETGALLAEHSTTMGHAQVQPWNCLAHQGTFCSVCAEQCPVPGALRLEQGRPRVDEEACVGCGICLYACPAPNKALMILPTGAGP